jgi:uncharacterized protein (DUF1800 family)
MNPKSHSNRSAPRAGRWRAPLVAALAALLLAACGGGGGGGGGDSPPPAANNPPPAGNNPPPVAVEKPATRDDAVRFLTQSTFGAVETDLVRLMDVGYAAWIDEQFAKPRASHREAWEEADRIVKIGSPTATAGFDGVLESFWKQAIGGQDQLRQRVAYALSQIFVISSADETISNNARAHAAFLDTLATDGLTNYRQLLEQVSLHPMMGVYLSHLRNQKANTNTGRVPDENYAREVMQLFSIGLVELNEDGTPRLVNGQPVETYTPADISGLARVFTGLSWACPNWPDNNCFFNGIADGQSDPDRAFKPMLGYPQYHSAEAKSFLGTNIAAQSRSDPEASLRTALDAIARHPNVGPFVGRQLIQRLVTSNPSPEYVRAVARVFNDNGSGVRGDMKAVVKAILMHPEARQTNDRSGKAREPVLKLSAFLRAFPHSSDTGRWRVGNTDNPGTQLGQTPLRAPSVFNFYRPGYVAPNTRSAAANLVAPELQIASETTAAGWVNFVRDGVANGFGSFNATVNGVVLNRRDLQPDYSAEVALADQPAALVDRVVGKLLYGTVPASLKSDIATAIGTISLSSSDPNAVAANRRNRVNATLLLVMASPEFQVQK